MNRITAQLDGIANELEVVDPRLALALDKVSDQIEAGLFSNIINKIKTTLSKIPQAQEIFKIITGLDPQKAAAKLKESIGKIDRETFDAALKMVKNPQAAPGLKESADLKRTIMTAVLLMLLSNITGKAFAQDPASLDDQYEIAIAGGSSVDHSPVKQDPNVIELLKIISPGYEPGDRAIPPSESMQEAYAEAKAKGIKVETKAELRKMMDNYYAEHAKQC